MRLFNNHTSYKSKRLIAGYRNKILLELKLKKKLEQTQMIHGKSEKETWNVSKCWSSSAANRERANPGISINLVSWSINCWWNQFHVFMMPTKVLQLFQRKV